MARTKKNKIFELFKSSFKITFFYKPTIDDDELFYYIILDDIIQVRLKVVDEVAVIDMVVPITKSYITPIYDKFVNDIMNQDRITVLISTIGDTFSIHQSCIKFDAPLIDDETYRTVSYGVYQKYKNQYNGDLTKYGFYILSVSNEKSMETQHKKVVASDIPSNKKDINPIKGNSTIDSIKNLFIKNMEPINIEDLSEKSFKCYLTSTDSFIIELDNGHVGIKEVLQNPDSTFNLVKIMDLLNVFEQIVSIVPNVFILNIQNMEIYRLCNGKGYKFISEDTKLPKNGLFKQPFLGYGSFKIIIN